MIKECPILINNSAVTVVKYDEVEIQLPAINKDVKTIFIDLTDGRYTIVDNQNAQRSNKKVDEQSTKGVKKTTKESVKTKQRT